MLSYHCYDKYGAPLQSSVFSSQNNANLFEKTTSFDSEKRLNEIVLIKSFRQPVWSAVFLPLHNVNAYFNCGSPSAEVD